MKIEMLDFLNLLWGVALAAYLVLWRRLDRADRMFADRATIIHAHETRISVLETKHEDTRRYFEKIEKHLERIEKKLDAKADK